MKVDPCGRGNMVIYYNVYNYGYIDRWSARVCPPPVQALSLGIVTVEYRNFAKNKQKLVLHQRIDKGSRDAPRKLWNTYWRT